MFSLLSIFWCSKTRSSDTSNSFDRFVCARSDSLQVSFAETDAKCDGHPRCGVTVSGCKDVKSERRGVAADIPLAQWIFLPASRPTVPKKGQEKLL